MNPVSIRLDRQPAFKNASSYVLTANLPSPARIYCGRAGCNELLGTLLQFVADLNGEYHEIPDPALGWEPDGLTAALFRAVLDGATFLEPAARFHGVRWLPAYELGALPNNAERGEVCPKRRASSEKIFRNPPSRVRQTLEAKRNEDVALAMSLGNTLRTGYAPVGSEELADIARAFSEYRAPIWKARELAPQSRRPSASERDIVLGEPDPRNARKSLPPGPLTFEPMLNVVCLSRHVSVFDFPRECSEDCQFHGRGPDDR